MIKASLIFLVSFLFSGQLLAQGNWLRSAGGTASEETKDAIFDSNGMLVMTGFFNGAFNTGVGTLN